MKFYKESDKWYIDLPEWPGERWELEMVCGADTMLDIAAQGETTVYLNILDTDPRYNPNDPNSLPILLSVDTLVKIKDTPDIGGALYMLKTFRGIEYNLEVWLCHVIEFVFGSIPEKIYIV